MARIGLVLGAGGVTGGAFHAAVLSTIAERTGWDPRTADVIVGTSAGSVTAAALRAGLPARDLAARALGEPLSPEGAAVVARTGLPPGPPPVPGREGGARFRLGRPADLGVIAGAMRRPWQAKPGAILAGLMPSGSVSTDDIVKATDALHPSGWPTQPTWVCAATLRDGTLVVLGRQGAPRTSVGRAVAASCAIPGYFEPVVIGNDRYVDGGVVSTTNAEQLSREELDVVIVSAPMLIGRPRLALEVAALRRRNVEVITFVPTPADQRVMGADALDPNKRAAVVTQVRTSMTSGRADRRLARLQEVLGQV